MFSVFLEATTEVRFAVNTILFVCDAQDHQWFIMLG